MTNTTKLESFGKYAAILSALVAATVGIAQFRRGVAQSERELEWKQAEMARTLTNAMLNDEGWEAVTMLDFVEGRTFEIAPDTRVHIRPADVPPALEAAVQATRRQRTETQRFITDRYDRLFFLVSQMESAVRSGLVRREDVRFPLSWYVEKRFCKNKKLILDYIAENSAQEARQFFESLEAWQRCPAA